jgi:hypothetical protein
MSQDLTLTVSNPATRTWIRRWLRLLNGPNSAQVRAASEDFLREMRGRYKERRPFHCIGTCEVGAKSQTELCRQMIDESGIILHPGPSQWPEIERECFGACRAVRRRKLRRYEIDARVHALEAMEIIDGDGEQGKKSAISPLHFFELLSRQPAGASGGALWTQREGLKWSNVILQRDDGAFRLVTFCYHRPPDVIIPQVARSGDDMPGWTFLVENVEVAALLPRRLLLTY